MPLHFFLDNCLPWTRWKSVVCSYNPSYLAEIERMEVRSQLQANSLQDSISKITSTKWMPWGCGLSRRVPALQTQSHKFKPQSQQQQKKKTSSLVLVLNAICLWDVLARLLAYNSSSHSTFNNNHHFLFFCFFLFCLILAR
jgi:hypothetical protein